MDFDRLGDSLRADLQAKYAAREMGLPLSRTAIRLSANAIRAIHRGDKSEGERLLDEARLALDEAATAMAEHPDIKYAGFLHDAAKEYAEGRLTYALVFQSPIPTPDEIRVEPQAYLNGLGEAVGEMRRHILDLMRTGDLGRSEELMETMDEIYHLLTTMDFPDAMTGGLRRTTDVARSIIERTRGDLATTIMQQSLKNALDERHKAIDPG